MQPAIREALPPSSAPSAGELHVIKRNGTVVLYTDDKISIAIGKAFLAVEGDSAADSSRIHDTVQQLTRQITATFRRRMPSGGTVHIEDIQDQVELALMRSGEHKVARSYVLYREARAQERERLNAGRQLEPQPIDIRVKKADGSLKPMNLQRFKTVIAEACEGLSEADPEVIERETLKNLYDGVNEQDVATALVISARSLVERDPDYSYVSARLLLDSLRREALDFLDLDPDVTHSEMARLYARLLPIYIAKGIELELLDPRLAAFDLERLGNALTHHRDQQFTYLGLQTLYDRYFLHSQETRFELPQLFYMRVAMGLAIEENGDREARVIAFYDLLSSFDYMTSTPTLFNAGTLRPQLSSCYLTTVPDNLSGIYQAIHDNAMLSKFAGGLGNDWTPVRALGAYIKGTNGKSQGVVPFLKVVNDTAVAVNQGGKRKGAVCAYLESWHLDIEDFLELRKNTGDERRRTHDMNTANWIPDLFMKRVFNDLPWTLFSPSDVPDLHDLYGQAFEERYTHYETLAHNGQIKLYRVVQAKDLWRKMLSMAFETGHPWLTFKDPCNLRSPQQHAGVIHSSNLCTEITLNTSADEIAVCNLGSINLVNHIRDGQLDTEKLARTVKTAVRMLDNVIDINYYAVEQARNANLRHRPVGLGLMGFQDALYLQHIPYGSSAAVDFADRSMEIISYHAIQASCELAEERGSYSSFDGSLWSQGILPIDTLQQLSDQRSGAFSTMDRSQRLDWAPLRERVKKGMRNSNVMAIAPTATIANITGVTQSIEPTYQNLYVKSNLSGEFTVINPYLVRDLKAQGLWDPVMLNDLKYYDGSVQRIERIPEQLKAIYATAFEIEPHWLIEAAGRRQKWIDQAQSLNLYLAMPSGRKLDEIYKLAWTSGLKSTYYLRSLGATAAEKTSQQTASYTPDEAAPRFCSIDNPDCEACQ